MQFPKFCFPTLLLVFSVNLTAQTTQELTTQEYLEQLFGSGQTYWQIKTQADAYFQNKYPNYSAEELCVGEHRDGDFVKYQRWLSFWKDHLNDDGSLGDFTQTTNAGGPNKASKMADCSDSQMMVDWNNINYSGNMGWQIDQGRTCAIAFHPTNPDIFFVGAGFGGLWKTTDGGINYVNLNDNLPHMAVSSIIIDPANPDHMAIALSDNVWYGPPTIGVYITNDGGLTFNESSLTSQLNLNRYIYYMDQNPSNPNEIMLACSNGIFKTIDFFETYDQITAWNTRSIKYSKTNSNIVYAGGSNGQFYKSEDGGENFTMITDFGTGTVRVAVSHETGSARVAASNGLFLYTSEDHGATFGSSDLPEDNMVIEFAKNDDNIILAGNFEVYRSNNFGASFSTLTHWLGDAGLPHIHVDQRNVFVNPNSPDFIYLCNDGGITRYRISTGDFTNLSEHLNITQYYDIAVSQTETMVVGAGSQDNGNVSRDTDGSWFAYASTGDGMGQEIDPSNADTRYFSYQYGGLRRWVSGGVTNIEPPGEDNEAGDWETPFKIDPNNSNRIVVGYNSVYASDDQGDTWVTIGDVVNPIDNLETIAIAPSNSNKIYATQHNNLYVKSAGVDAWSEFGTPINQSITDLEVDPLDENTIYISYAGYSAGNKVFKSVDGGANWTNISGSLPNLPIMSLETYETNPGGVFVGTYGAVYYVDDQLGDWVKVGCVPNTSVKDIEIQYFTNKIFIGTHGRGIFEAELTFQFASVWSYEENQGQLTLYPNPAQDVVYIASTDSDINNATVRLTDATGKELAFEYTVNSTNQLTITNLDLKPGIYFVRIEMPDRETAIMKFICE